MRINHVHIRGFKRFRTSGIKEFEADFVEPVVIITGSNNSGKSSLLKELCPLPSVRTDYEPDGFKVLEITHEGNNYRLVSDFTNRTSPHSFAKNNRELNVSGSTDVQVELVEKHFGITPMIRNLIYSKITLCQTTKSERKNLFLNINPLDLGLILDTHKKTLSCIKECKSQLNLLLARKTDLESKMLRAEELEANKVNKDRLTSEILAIDKIIYGLEQHIGFIKERFSPDIGYRNQCADRNQLLLPDQDIITHCKDIIRQMYKFTVVPRGKEFFTVRDRLNTQRTTLSTRREELYSIIRRLSEEINEYQKHLDSSTKKPVRSLEDELTEIETTLKKYPKLPDNPIPENLIANYEQKLEEIRSIAFTFRDAPVKLIELSELQKLRKELNEKSRNRDSVNWELASITKQLNELLTEREGIKTTSGIPDNCVETRCSLRNNIVQRLNSITAQITSLEKQQKDLEKVSTELSKQCEQINTQLKPIDDYHLEELYYKLLDLLNTGYFHIQDWSTELLNLLQQQPLRIVKILEEYIQLSSIAIEHQKLDNRRKQLVTEIEAMMKSTGASTEFLQKKIKEKEKDISEYFGDLHKIDKQVTDITTTWNLFTEFQLLSETVQKYQEMYDKGERALIVSKALTYWTAVLDKFHQAKRMMSEELRKLESIVREQDLLFHTYNTEILKNISIISHKKLKYEKVELALSPNTGLPHKSMVKYLNAMINNVNYFLSQIWTSRMYIHPIDTQQALDYSFRMEVGNDIRNDINALSDGQTEVMNLCWVLTILLQMKMLNKIPLFADELGRTFDPIHRVQILKFLDQMIDSKYIEQLFLVNHFAIFTDGFTNSDFICLHADNIPELPQDVNEHVRISRH